VARWTVYRTVGYLLRQHVRNSNYFLYWLVNKIPVNSVSYVPNPNWSDLCRPSIVRLMQSGSLWCVGHVIRIQEVHTKF
jgi:hypothetical protein